MLMGGWRFSFEFLCMFGEIISTGILFRGEIDVLRK
jgi:hypothetical protein